MVIDPGLTFLSLLFAFMILKIYGKNISDFRKSRKVARELRKAKRAKNRELKAANAARIKAEGNLRAQRELEVKRNREREEQERASALTRFTLGGSNPPSGTSVEQSVADIIELLNAALPDAAKHDRGIKVAGTRLRKAMLSIKHDAQDVRIKVQRDRKNR